jgi:hypothetical protein
MSQPITLAQALVSLRKDLEIARQQAKNENLQFKVEDIEVELQISSTSEFEGEFGANGWMLSVKGAGKLSDQTSHKIKLKLIPIAADGTDVLLSSEGKKPV